MTPHTVVKHFDVFEDARTYASQVGNDGVYLASGKTPVSSGSAVGVAGGGQSFALYVPGQTNVSLNPLPYNPSTGSPTVQSLQNKLPSLENLQKNPWAALPGSGISLLPYNPETQPPTIQLLAYNPTTQSPTKQQSGAPDYEKYKEEYKKIEGLKYKPKGADEEGPFFPRLTKHDGSQYQVVGPSTRDYNCFAYAAGRQKSVFPEDLFDPATDPTGVGLGDDAKKLLKGDFTPLDKYYGELGYKRTATWPGGLTNRNVDDKVKLEKGTQKVIIFGRRDPATGKIVEITHAAVQQPNGKYRSKLGGLALIEHNWEDISGGGYGQILAVYERPVKGFGEKKQ